MFSQSIHHELWETIINGLFIPIPQVNDEVVDKCNSLWTKKERRKFEIDFKMKNFIIMCLDGSNLYYGHCFKITKETWDTLEMIYGVLPSIKQEKMKMWGKEKVTTFGCFSNFRNIENYVGNCITNKYLRIKSFKFNLILKSKDGSLHEFQEKSKKQKIVEKLNYLIQLLKDEEVKTKESSTSSYSYHITHVQSFKRTHSVVEQSSEDSTSNEGPSCSRNNKEK